MLHMHTAINMARLSFFPSLSFFGGGGVVGGLTPSISLVTTLELSMVVGAGIIAPGPGLHKHPRAHTHWINSIPLEPPHFASRFRMAVEGSWFYAATTETMRWCASCSVLADSGGWLCVWFPRCRHTLSHTEQHALPCTHVTTRTSGPRTRWHADHSTQPRMALCNITSNLNILLVKNDIRHTHYFDRRLTRQNTPPALCCLCDGQ